MTVTVDGVVYKLKEWTDKNHVSFGRAYHRWKRFGWRDPWELIKVINVRHKPTEQMLKGVMETDSKARAVTVNGHKYSLYEWCKMFESCGGGSVQSVYYRWSRGERDPYRLVGVEPTKPFTQEDLDWLRETRPYRKGQEDEWEIACDLIGQPHIMASVLKDAIKAEDAKNPI